MDKNQRPEHSCGYLTNQSSLQVHIINRDSDGRTTR
jgi:hypothetical protein